MDSPLLRAGELSDELVFYEELDDLFTHASCREGSYWRFLSLDLEGNIVHGLLGHSEVAGVSNICGGCRLRSGYVVHATSCGCVVRGGWGLVVSPNSTGSFLGRSGTLAIRFVTSIGAFVIPDALVVVASLIVVVPFRKLA